MPAPEWTVNQLTKLYKQQPALVSQALDKLLQADPELRWSLVLSAYLDNEINLGKAAELLDIHPLELKERFVKLGIPIRQGPASLAEAQAEVEALKEWSTDGSKRTAYPRRG